MNRQHIRRPVGLLAAMAMGLAALLAVGAAPLARAAEAIRAYALTKGHIDLFEVTYDQTAGGLKLSVKDDTRLYDSEIVFRDPSDVSVVIDAATASTDVSGVPAALDFLKVDGNTVYLLGQTQVTALPWPGWSTERLTSTLPAGTELAASGQPVQLDIQIEGAGNVFAWQNGTFGGVQNKYVDTVDPAADVIPIARNAHVHTNWAFTEPGDYLLTVTPSATTTTGATLTGDSAVYHVHVGDAAATAAPENTVLPVVVGEPKVGSAVTAEPGTWTPTPDEFHYEWLVDDTVVEGADGAAYTPVPADSGRQLSVRVTAIKSGRQAASAVSLGVPVAEAAAPAVDIVGFPQSFIHGEPHTLTAEHSPSVDEATYRWEAKLAGSADWITISNAQGPISTAELHFTPVTDWDGSLWRVALLDGSGVRVAESESYEMRVSLPTPTEDGLHILGLVGHYHSGAAITLNAVLLPEDDASGTYRWSVKRADQSGFQTVADATGTTFSLTAEQALDGARVKVERWVGGEVVAAAEPVIIAVDDHGSPALQTVGISGANEYVAGKTATLTADVSPATVLSRYQWYLKPAGSDVVTPIAGANAATYAFTAGNSHNGASFTVAVIGDDGEVVYGPSAAHTLTVTTPTVPVPATTSIRASAVKQIYGKSAKLKVTVSPNASGRITVKAGAKTVTGTLTGGVATVVLPAKALKPGHRTVAVSFAGVAGKFAPATAVAQVTVVKATPKVTVKAVKSKVKRGKKAVLRVTVKTQGVKPAGRITVKAAGKSKTVKLSAKGRATVRITISKRAKTGKKKVSVSYSGNAYVAKGKAKPVKIRVIR